MAQGQSVDLSQQAIGIFDSGIGGLTVAHAVAQALPHENIIYFGDTAHLPYGDKSAKTIQRYCLSIVDFLLAQDCKVILVACNSATAAAYEMLQDYLKDKVLLLGVVDPVVTLVSQQFTNQTVGLIGTKQTVNSQIFAKKLAASSLVSFKALATPLLVPVIEEGFHQHNNLVDQVLELYLNKSELHNIDALILGCTHYPLVKSRISQFYKNQIPLLDAAEITAKALKQLLIEHNLLNLQETPGQHQFYVSDHTPAFAQMANEFFGEYINLGIKVLEK